MWLHNSPDVKPVDYCIWVLMQERVYHTSIQDVADLQQNVMSTSAGIQLSAVVKRLDACVRAQDHHFEQLL